MSSGKATLHAHGMHALLRKGQYIEKSARRATLATPQLYQIQIALPTHIATRCAVCHQIQQIEKHSLK